MRAVAYIRVSTDRQELSPEAQEAKIRQFAAFHGYELAEVITDIATSGRTPFEQRGLGRRALATLEGCEAIIFAKLSRAFRSAADAMTLVPRLLKAGKDVFFLDMGVSVRTPTGKMVMGVLAVQAEWEADIISERITEALAAAKRQGKKIGPAPYGSINAARRGPDGRKVNGGLHASVDDEQAVIRRIRSLRAQDLSLAAIADVLTREHVPTRRGGRWAAETIRRVLARG